VTLSKILTLAALTALLAVPSPALAAGPAAPRVLAEVNNYKLGKFEPVQGTYLGAYVLQDTLINGSMSEFNRLTGKKHASFFLYSGYGHQFPQQWFDDVEEAGAVPHLAWEPNRGLDEIKDNAYLRDFAKKLSSTGVPVFLRFASEMNGTWAPYSGNPKEYIEKWRLVHDVMAEEAPNVIMVWTVFTFPTATVTDYYPGDDYVDWVGVNIYNVIYHNNDINSPAAHEDPLELLDFVYNTFSRKKPIQISEFGVTHYTITDSKHYQSFAIDKLSRMYTGIRSKYPRVKSIFYFDVNNLINAPIDRRINNYALTDNMDILSNYSNLIDDENFLSDISKNLEGEKDKELFNITDRVYLINGTTYVSTASLRDLLGASLMWQPGERSIQLSHKDTEIVFPVRPLKNVGNQSAFIINGRSYLPLRTAAAALGYKLAWDADNNLIKVLLPERSN